MRSRRLQNVVAGTAAQLDTKFDKAGGEISGDVIVSGDTSQIRIGVPDEFVPSLTPTRLFVAQNDPTPGLNYPTAIFQIAERHRMHEGMPVPPTPDLKIERFHVAFGHADATKFHRIRSSGGSNDGFSIETRDFRAGLDLQYRTGQPSGRIVATTAGDTPADGSAFLIDGAGRFLFADRSQLALTTTTPTAAIEIRSKTKGFLPPRMTAAEALAIASPAEGLMIYVTNTGAAPFTTKGWFGYDGAAWKRLSLDT